ncbi:MAG: ATP-dependent helicase [Leptospirales bacterium]
MIPGKRKIGNIPQKTDQKPEIPKSLEKFLDNFSMTPAKNSAVESRGSFEDLTLRDYTWPEDSPFAQERIVRYAKIGKAIDKMSLTKAPDFFILETARTKAGEPFRVQYARDLNEPQLAAISTTKGPLLVIAGAGSGKTRTLTYRASFLLENGVDPSKILLLTFTRKAAQEMLNRTQELLQNKKASQIMGGTFHSFANYALRRYSGLLNLAPSFSIIDTTDSEDIIALIRDEEHFQTGKRAFPKKGRIHEIISKSRNTRLSIEAIIERYFSGLADFAEAIILIAEIYDRYKKANRLFDYDDLIDVLVESLQTNERFRKKIQETYEYVMVDEYQDTNIPQKELVDLLAGLHKNIMVVGDDSQSIYSFRGANFENILTFPETWPDCRVVKVEENYRSNQGLLDFSNDIIHNAKLGYRKKLFSANKEKFLPVYRSFYDQEAEAEWIVSKILESRENSIELSSIAILVRAMFHSNYIQIELTKRAIPYVVVGGIKFSERKHVRDIVSFLKVSANGYDAPAWMRILKLIDGVGDTTAKKIIMDIRESGGVAKHEPYKNTRYYNDLKSLFRTILTIAKEDMPVSQKIDKIREFYGPVLKKREDDYELRMRDIEVLYNYSGNYDDTESFLSDFALDPPSTKFQNRNIPLIDEGEEKPLVISTVHSAKGLEWHTVFVPHLLDGLFPSIRSIETLDEIEEERRLFYVACTRAKARLYLTAPSYFAAWGAVMTLPTRFLVEVNPKLWKVERNKPIR